MESKSGHIVTLDALRGVAALMVVLFHATGRTDMGDFPPRSFLAVDFFFVLSGFVIARGYEGRLMTRMSLGSFISVRLIRLYPLIFLGMILGFIGRLVAYHFSVTPDSRLEGPSLIVKALAFGLLLLPERGLYGFLFPLDGPTWSLMFEFWVNLAYGVVVRLLTTPVLIFVAATGGAALALTAGINHGINFGFLYSKRDIVIGIIRVWFSFFSGVMIHRWSAARTEGRLPRIPAVVLATVLIASFLPPASWVGAWYEVAVVMLLYPAIVVLGIRAPVSARLNSAAVMAGVLSYPAYMLHSFIFSALANYGILTGPATVALAVSLVLVISYAANRWYDEPVRKWLNAWRSRGGRRIENRLEAPAYTRGTE